MNAVVGQRMFFLAEQPVQIDEEMVALLRHIADGIRIQSQVLVVLFRIRQRTAEVFLLQRRQKDDARLRRGERIQQCLQSLHEARQSLRSLERFIRPIANENHRRLEGEDVVFQLAEAIRGVAEAGAGVAEHGIAAPAEIAEDDRLIGIPARQRGLPVAVALLAFDECATDQHDAISLDEPERIRRSHGLDRQHQRATKGSVHIEIFHRDLSWGRHSGDVLAVKRLYRKEGPGTTVSGLTSLRIRRRQRWWGRGPPSPLGGEASRNRVRGGRVFPLATTAHEHEQRNRHEVKKACRHRRSLVSCRSG